MYTGAAQADVKTEAVNVNNVTYYAFLRVYTLMCITLMVAPRLFLVNIHIPGTVLIIGCIFVSHD